jgi:hypothetical protein
MAATEQEYVIAPWGEGERDTEVVTVELPARELIAQVEVPVEMLERTADIADEHDLTVEQALGERLERNRARVAVWAAEAVDDVAEIRDHLTEAREYLSAVETLDTSELETRVEQVWQSVLDAE